MAIIYILPKYGQYTKYGHNIYILPQYMAIKYGHNIYFAHSTLNMAIIYFAHSTLNMAIIYILPTVH